MLSPRVFISYRHQESEDDEAFNTAHRAWVRDFAGDLIACGIEVIWDEDMRRCLAPHCAIDPLEVPLCQEISRAFPPLCNVFIPIVTPAYLERIGISDGRAARSFRYGAVFEEWQGAADMALQGSLAIMPVVRRGQAHQLNLGPIAPFFTLHGRLLDFRGEARSNYERQFNRLVAAIKTIDKTANPFSFIDLQDWCDAYLDWSRAEFPYRIHAPVETWWSDTGAGQNFLIALRTFMQSSPTEIELTSASLASNTQACFRARNQLSLLLQEWRAEVCRKSTAHEVPLTCSNLLEIIGAALNVQNCDYGWLHLEKSAQFCNSALGRETLQGGPADRAKVHNNIAMAIVRLAGKSGERTALDTAIEHLRCGLDYALQAADANIEYRVRKNLATALADRAGDDAVMIEEALSHYAQILANCESQGDHAASENLRAKVSSLKSRLP